MPETAEQRHERKMAELHAQLAEIEANHERWAAQHQGRPSTFDTYSAFHKTELSEDEQLLMEDAEAQEKYFEEHPVSEDRLWRKGFIDGDYRLALYPKLAANMRIALERAETQMMRYPFPEEPGLTDKYPGVDPRGKYTEAEMAVAERLEKVKAALAVRPPEVQAYVGSVLSDLGNGNTALGRKMITGKERGMELRTLSRAAKVALDRDTSEHLQEEFDNKLPTTGAYKWAEQTVQTLECLAGLRDDPITDEQRQSLSQDGRPIPDGLEALRSAPNVQPEHIEVDFPSFDNITAYQYLSHPANWGKGMRQVPQDAARVEPVAAAVTRYANAVADRAIDPMFRQTEERFSKELLGGQMDRGKLIIVDGMTVEERMQLEFSGLENPDPPNFHQWYGANLRRLSAEMVSGALMAGKRVEAFIPDEKGRIPKEPAQLTKTGFEPSPLKKVTLNAWERHFARHGFYKEKAAKAVEYQRAMDARERLQTAHTLRTCAIDSYASMSMRTSFFGNPQFHEQPGLPNNEGFRLSRTAAQTACICMMAASGKYQIEDLFDPTKLQAEKLEAGRVYLEKAKANDTDWLGATFYDGMNKVTDHVFEQLKGVNLADPKTLTEKLPWITKMSTFCMDVAQEMELSPNMQGVLRHAQAEAGRETDARVYQSMSRASWFARVGQALENVVRNRNDLCGPAALAMEPMDAAMAVGRVVSAPELIQSIQNTIANPPQKYHPEAPGAYDYVGIAEPKVKALVDSVFVNDKPDPVRMRALSSMARSGDLAREIQPHLSVTETTVKKDAFHTEWKDGKPTVVNGPVDTPHLGYDVTTRVSKSFGSCMQKHLGLTGKAQQLEARVEQNAREAQAKQAKEQQTKQPKPAQPKPMGGGRVK